ncbi:hypothetical protein J6590_010704 [Homalodisca vitripennis]|nr:hypothetical protein J6590_010704 [Homalodisca vitripennis]
MAVPQATTGLGPSRGCVTLAGTFSKTLPWVAPGAEVRGVTPLKVKSKKCEYGTENSPRQLQPLGISEKDIFLRDWVDVTPKKVTTGAARPSPPFCYATVDVICIFTKTESGYHHSRQFAIPAHKDSVFNRISVYE